jgi:hypothetical protein
MLQRGRNAIHRAMIRVYRFGRQRAGNVIETNNHKGEFEES